MADDVRGKIAAEVRAEIARQGKSTRQIAEALGVRSRQGISVRLRGEQSFTAEELIRLAEVLGVPVEQFLRTSASAA